MILSTKTVFVHTYPVSACFEHCALNINGSEMFTNIATPVFSVFMTPIASSKRARKRSHKLRGRENGYELLIAVA